MSRKAFRPATGWYTAPHARDLRKLQALRPPPFHRCQSGLTRPGQGRHIHERVRRVWGVAGKSRGISRRLEPRRTASPEDRVKAVPSAQPELAKARRADGKGPT